MVTERVVEVPWALQHVPHSGTILDVGSCEATYLTALTTPGRLVHCIDPRDCSAEMPPGVAFFQESLLENRLAKRWYDCVLLISTLEHIGLPYYGQPVLAGGDRAALRATWELLKQDAILIVTLPVGRSKLATWYRQYSPADLEALFADWDFSVRYWAFDGRSYQEASPEDVKDCDYRERFDEFLGAGAVAGVIARRPIDSYR